MSVKPGLPSKESVKLPQPQSSPGKPRANQEAKAEEISSVSREALEAQKPSTPPQKLTEHHQVKPLPKNEIAKEAKESSLSSTEMKAEREKIGKIFEKKAVPSGGKGIAAQILTSRYVNKAIGIPATGIPASAISTVGTLLGGAQVYDYAKDTVKNPTLGQATQTVAYAGESVREATQLSEAADLVDISHLKPEFVPGLNLAIGVMTLVSSSARAREIYQNVVENNLKIIELTQLMESGGDINNALAYQISILNEKNLELNMELIKLAAEGTGSAFSVAHAGMALAVLSKVAVASAAITATGGLAVAIPVTAGLAFICRDIYKNPEKWQGYLTRTQEYYTSTKLGASEYLAEQDLRSASETLTTLSETLTPQEIAETASDERLLLKLENLSLQTFEKKVDDLKGAVFETFISIEEELTLATLENVDKKFNEFSDSFNQLKPDDMETLNESCQKLEGLYKDFGEYSGKIRAKVVELEAKSRRTGLSDKELTLLNQLRDVENPRNLQLGTMMKKALTLNNELQEKQVERDEIAKELTRISNIAEASRDKAMGKLKEIEKEKQLSYERSKEAKIAGEAVRLERAIGKSTEEFIGDKLQFAQKVQELKNKLQKPSEQPIGLSLEEQVIHAQLTVEEHKLLEIIKASGFVNVDENAEAIADRIFLGK